MHVYREFVDQSGPLVSEPGFPLRTYVAAFLGVTEDGRAAAA